MKLRILIVAIAGAGLALIPAAADAKGVKDMTLSGPGLARPIQLVNGAAPSPNTNDLAQKAGLFAALFRETPDPITAARPSGHLGPGTSPGITGSSAQIRPGRCGRTCIRSPRRGPSPTRRRGRRCSKRQLAGAGTGRAPT